MDECGLSYKLKEPDKDDTGNSHERMSEKNVGYPLFWDQPRPMAFVLTETVVMILTSPLDLESLRRK